MIYSIFFYCRFGPTHLFGQFLFDAALQQLDGAIGETVHKVIAQVNSVFPAHGLGRADDISGHDVSTAGKCLDDH